MCPRTSLQSPHLGLQGEHLPSLYPQPLAARAQQRAEPGRGSSSAGAGGCAPERLGCGRAPCIFGVVVTLQGGKPPYILGCWLLRGGEILNTLGYWLHCRMESPRIFGVVATLQDGGPHTLGVVAPRKAWSALGGRRGGSSLLNVAVTFTLASRALESSIY